MIEAYVLISLLGVGYIVTAQRQQGQLGNQSSSLAPSGRHFGGGGGGLAAGPSPSFQRSVYYNQNFPEAKRREQLLSVRAQRASQQPGTNVISDFYREQRSEERMVRNLAGEFIPMESFLPSDAKPYFGGWVRQQGVEQDQYASAKLEHFTGATPPLVQAKREVEFFGDKDAPANVFGNPVNDSRERIVPPVSRRNDLPFQQERVGVGKLDVDMEVRSKIAPKTVDDLRALSRPKLGATEGRVMPGGPAAGGQRTEFGEITTDMPDLVEKSTETFLLTTGAFTKPQMESQPVVRSNVRSQQGAQGERMGAAYLGGGAAHYADAPPAPTNRSRTSQAASGRGGYLTGLVKAITAPVMDVLQFTLKDSVAVCQRIAPVQPQMPSMAPQQPSAEDVPATAKDSLLHSTVGTGHLSGPTKTSVFTDQAARTTTKETTAERQHGGGWVRGPNMTTVYTDQVARTTVKETIEFSDHGGYLTGSGKCVAVYDPESVAAALLKTTVRETTSDAGDAWVRNPGSKDSRPAERPEDGVRVTMKDLDVLAAEGHVAAPGGMQSLNSGYANAEVQVKDTLKQVTSDQDRGVSNAFVRGDLGHLATEYEAPETTRHLMHGQYFGQGNSAVKEEMDRETMRTERVNASKELLVEARVPTAQGAKSAGGADSIGEVRLNAMPNAAALGNSRPVMSTADRMTGGKAGTGTITRERAMREVDLGRLDPAAMKPEQENVFVADALQATGTA